MTSTVSLWVFAVVSSAPVLSEHCPLCLEPQRTVSGPTVQCHWDHQTMRSLEPACRRFGSTCIFEGKPSYHSMGYFHRCKFS